ncbi:MAG: hypothetical protein IT306_10325 [Chloroflexi bacterium]|nr:hypothetical protein [Chloroflexota bacterium]
MSRSIVVKSFADLPRLLDLEELPTGPAEDAVEPPPAENVAPDRTPDLSELLAELEAASATLAAVARQDQATRALALRDLEQYDALAATLQEAERARDGACDLKLRAEELADGAFAEEARTTAAHVAGLAARAEEAAARLADARCAELKNLAARLDVGRLLAERRRQEEADRLRAAEAERAGRLSGALAEASEALRAGRLEEAKALAGVVSTEDPNNAEAASLVTIIAQREAAVKSVAAEETLWTVRRELRRSPAEAVARLEGIDVDGLPTPLAAQVFGEWARACSRLCRERGLAEPLRYAPDPGRGAILARESGGEYVVVSALGMGPAWEVGSVVGERQVRRARPLR